MDNNTISVAELLRAQAQSPALTEAAGKLAAAVKAREAFLKQETEAEVDSAEAAEIAQTLAELDADIKRWNLQMLWLMEDRDCGVPSAVCSCIKTCCQPGAEFIRSVTI